MANEINIKSFKGTKYINLSPAQLEKHIINRKEGERTSTGAVNVMTGRFTGRSPLDKFIVKDSRTANIVDWGEVNQAISETNFQKIRKDMLSLMEDQELYVQDGYACADTSYSLNVRLFAQYPYSALFASNMFLRLSEDLKKEFIVDWRILCVPEFQADTNKDGTRQGNFTIVNFTTKEVLIGGSGYTGEIKKSIFSVLNYILPKHHNVLSMHCAANIGSRGDTSLFFGLSGTGKTTLSADAYRRLIGDDEHGWSKYGVFNFEGGCYAKCIDLSAEKEPEIFAAIKKGALLENVVLNSDNTPNYQDSTITQNTRVSYPINHIENAKCDSMGGIPSNIFFLTCDAFGVLPPISKLNTNQAVYHFLSGYTAKIAGTEDGVKEPMATFSACFGAPFLPLEPFKYAKMLGEKIEAHQVKVWLINTGWSGGAYGTGNRISLKHTRRMISAVHNNELEDVSFHKVGAFNLCVPKEIKGVPSVLLHPRETWTDKSAYDNKEAVLVDLYTRNFNPFVKLTSLEVLNAQPKRLKLAFSGIPSYCSINKAIHQQTGT